MRDTEKGSRDREIQAGPELVMACYKVVIHVLTRRELRRAFERDPSLTETDEAKQTLHAFKKG